MDWALIAAIAGVATALFTGYAVVQRAIADPKPRWKAIRGPIAGPSEHGWWSYVDVENVGDGVAYDARLTVGNGCDIHGAPAKSRAASVENGGRLTIAVAVRIRADPTRDAHGNAIDVDVDDDDFGDTFVMVTWTHPPHRWLRRRRRFRLRTLRG